MNTSEKQNQSENGRSYELRYIIDQKNDNLRNFDISYLDAKIDSKKCIQKSKKQLENSIAKIRWYEKR